LLRCHHRPHAADAATTLPAVAAPLLRCLRRSANAATALPTLPPRFCRRFRAAAIATALPPPLLPPCCPASPLLTAAELHQKLHHVPYHLVNALICLFVTFLVFPIRFRILKKCNIVFLLFLSNY
jgi:hypothetical protein